jgi:hypothetical protein
MAATNPFYGTLVNVDQRRDDADPAQHGVDYALELRIGSKAGQPSQAAPGGGSSGSWWRWLGLRAFGGQRH